MSSMSRIFDQMAAAAAAATASNAGVQAVLDVEVQGANVALVWSATPPAGATIASVTALLGALKNGVLVGQFAGAAYPVNAGTLQGTLSGLSAPYQPPAGAQKVAVLSGQVSGSGGMFFFTQPLPE